MTAHSLLVACACFTETLACTCARWLTSLANGHDGLRQTTEDAVLNANYIRKKLEGDYELPYKSASMHEVVFSDSFRSKKA